MIRRRFNKNRVKNLHERCLRLIYSDKTSLRKEVIEKEGLASIHYKDTQTLAVKMFKIMACILRLFLIYFCPGSEIIITLGNLRKLSFTFYMNSIS